MLRGRQAAVTALNACILESHRLLLLLPAGLFRLKQSVLSVLSVLQPMQLARMYAYAHSPSSSNMVAVGIALKPQASLSNSPTGTRPRMPP